jgi:hypothetical protein
MSGMFDWVSDGLDKLKDAAGEKLEAVGEGFFAGAVGALQGAQPEGYNQPATGQDGAGGTVYQAQPGTTGTESAGAMAGMPSWVLPVGIGLGAALTVGVVVMAVRG